MSRVGKNRPCAIIVLFILFEQKATSEDFIRCFRFEKCFVFKYIYSSKYEPTYSIFLSQRLRLRNHSNDRIFHLVTRDWVSTKKFTTSDSSSPDSDSQLRLPISACDYFLWGHLKAQLHTCKSCTLEALFKAITREIRRTMDNFATRLWKCLDNNGHHLSNMNFAADYFLYTQKAMYQ